jgi:hypothetical protein
MRILVMAGMSAVLVASMTGTAIGARPATHVETAALQRSARASLLFGDRASSVKVVYACISTAERGFAAVILHVPSGQPPQMITLFHLNPHLRPMWNMYGVGSPQNLWFAKTPTNPYARRLRAERDLKTNWACRPGVRRSSCRRSSAWRHRASVARCWRCMRGRRGVCSSGSGSALGTG